MKAIITGINGFIGSALNKKLLSMGWEVSETLSPDADYMFLFGSPSSNEWFKPALTYSVRETVENFMNAIDYCRENKIKLVYPSSGTVYDGKTSYAKTKTVLDTLAEIHGNILGLRIFAGYGVGEAHKGEYASVVYQFIQDMKKGFPPVIWGDGSQTRDFVYIDDIVENIILLRDEIGFKDIGTGRNTSFNQLVKIINGKLKKNIQPFYVDAPKKYLQNTSCPSPSFYSVSIEDGIERMINE